MNELSKNVMEEIKARKVKMRPRLYFVLVSALLGIGLAGVILSAVAFLAVATFRFRVYSPVGFLQLGTLGVRPFFLALPWPSLLIAVAGIGAGIWLMRKYDFSYKQGRLGVTAGVIAFVIVIGVAAGHFGLRDNIQGERAARFLHFQHPGQQNWLVGQINEVSDDGVTLTTPRGDVVKVMFDVDADEVLDSMFAIGQRVRVIGEWDDEVFSANGIVNGHARRFGPRGHFERKSPRRL